MIDNDPLAYLDHVNKEQAKDVGDSPHLSSPTPRSDKPKRHRLGYDELSEDYRLGKRPLLGTAVFTQNLKSWCGLLSEGICERVLFKSGRQHFCVSLSRSEGEGESDPLGSIEFGRMRDIRVDFSRVHGDHMYLGALSSTDYVSDSLMLDAGVLLALQVQPELISEEWLKKISVSKVMTSASVIGQIHGWIAGNDVIRDRMRIVDFMKVLCDGIHVLSIDSDVMMEAHHMRGGELFRENMEAKMLVAQARRSSAMVLTKNDEIMNYEFVDKACPFV